LAIEYNPRGEKRKNPQIREEDRKRILLENDVKNIQRGIKEDVQMGRGYMKLYNKVKNCDDDENLQKVMLGLSDKDIWRIQNCVFCYLDGSLDIGSEKFRNLVDEDEYMRKDMMDLVNSRYTIKEKKNFLSNNPDR